MSRKTPVLPDLDDDEFTRRLKPLEAMVFRESARPAVRKYIHPDVQHAGLPDNRATGTTQFSDAETSSNGNKVGGDSTAEATRRSVVQSSDHPEPKIDEPTETRRVAGSEESWAGLMDAAARQTDIERTRGPKRRFEYLIPVRVGDALAEDAARHGKSATVRLLEVLRDAGYPVIAEDLIDLRKQRRR
jgi:hypothetical protein